MTAYNLQEQQKRIRAVSPENKIRIGAIVEEELGRRIASQIPPFALAVLSELRSHHRLSWEHSVGLARRAQVATLCLGIARTDLGDAFVIGALTHDGGKIGVSKDVLNIPRKLNPEERAQIAVHPKLTFELLGRLLPLACRISVQHHEHGVKRSHRYPRAEPRGEGDWKEVLLGKLLARLDVLDAMLEDRPYRSAVSQSQALEAVMEIHRPGWEDVLQAAAAVRPRNAAF